MSGIVQANVGYNSMSPVVSPLPERILAAAIQGLSANMTVDPKQPQQIASMAVAITEATMKQVTGRDFKVSWDGEKLHT